MCPTFCRSHVIELYPVIVGFTAGRTCQPILIVSAAKTASFLVVSISQMRESPAFRETLTQTTPPECLYFCHCSECNLLHSTTSATAPDAPPSPLIHHLYNKIFLLQDVANHWRQIFNLNYKQKLFRHCTPTAYHVSKYLSNIKR